MNITKRVLFVEIITEKEEKSMLSERFYGMGEPLIQREGDTGVMAADYLDLVRAVGCTAYRSWMHLTDILTDPVTPNEGGVCCSQETS